MKSVEVSAPTREAAIQKGLDDLGLEMYEVDRIEIVDEGSKGIFGFGARPVKVRLVVENLQDAPEAEGTEDTQDRAPRGERGERGRRGGGRRGRRGGGKDQEARSDAPDEARPTERLEKPARTSEAKPDAEGKPAREGGRSKQRDGRRRGRRGGQEGGEPRGEQRKDGEVAQAEDKQRGERAGRKNDRPRRERNEASPQSIDAPRVPARRAVDPSIPPAPDEEETVIAITDEQGQEAAALVKELIAKMGMESEVAFTRSEDGAARLDVSAEDSAILIGRKGQNLNAMQYLVNRIISQHDTAENTERLVLDVEGYVDRRRATLEDMAHSFARRVKETGRSMRLKPLSPQERRIIHLTLQSDPEVRTYSLGESLFRSVVVSPADAENEVFDDEPERAPRRDRNGDSGRGPARERSVARAPEKAAPSAATAPKGDPKSDPKARKRGYGRYNFDEDIDVGRFGD